MFTINFQMAAIDKGRVFIREGKLYLICVEPVASKSHCSFELNDFQQFYSSDAWRQFTKDPGCLEVPYSKVYSLVNQKSDTPYPH